MSRPQSVNEQRANVTTHAAGVLLGLAAWGWLLARAGERLDATRIVAICVYGASLVALFLASALYHGARDEAARRARHVWDHALIYVLIAGTYTPIALVALGGAAGWRLFAAVWAVALAGVVVKLRWTGRFRAVSTASYLALGLAVVFVWEPLARVMPGAGMTFLAAGGAAYVLGVVFYVVERLPYNHVAWHGFVLAGAALHALAVASFV